MPTNTGGSQAFHDSAIQTLIGGGATIRLMTSTVSYGDTQTELSNNECTGTGYSAVSVAEADWSTSTDSTNRTTTLENDVEVDFGTTDSDWGTIVEVVIDPDDSTDNYVLADETDDPDLTGENYSFPAGQITYTLGANV